MRKSVKRKNLSEKQVLVVVTAEGFPKWEEYPTPRCFRKSGKCKTYGIRNLEECTENGRGSPLGPECYKVASNYHTAYYHMSIVLVNVILKEILK